MAVKMPGESMTSGLEKLPWTPDQRALIKEPPEARLLVSAGPGTGKTAVTCGRAAYLIDRKGLEPGNIWIVSFTRTAVYELRERISSYLVSAEGAVGIRIATIDSHAWSIHSGFKEGVKLTGSYDENIRQLIGMIKSHEGIFEYLSSVRHLFIDEAQDVVGLRCELMLELINALPDECGVTVLTDDAQAIYGFSEDAKLDTVDMALPKAIREYLNFDERVLSTIHRTEDEALQYLYGAGRSIVIKGRLGGLTRLKNMREFLSGANHGDVGAYADDMKGLPEDLQDAFLLFRRRGEALQASSYLGLRPHRLRMSALPPALHEWLGLLFWDWTQSEICFDDFRSRWSARVGGDPPITMDEAWQRLVRICGLSKQRISVQKLAGRLGRASPPIDLCRPDFGLPGPVVGTIHGSKGREAAEVRLYMSAAPSEDMKDVEAEEETRVLFVGATRAKERLLIGRGASTKARYYRAPSGRAYTPYAYGKTPSRASVEVGRENDVDFAGLVGHRLYMEAKDAVAAQKRLAKLVGRIANAEAVKAGAQREYRYALTCLDVVPGHLCYLSPSIDRDMWEIAKAVDAYVKAGKKKPPDRLYYLRVFGVRTVVVAPDDPVRETLHAPWRDSGFLLAPQVIGYGMVYFRY